MNNQIEQSQQNAVINQELGKRVVSEADLCWTLGVDRRIIDDLRTRKGFPCVYLNKVTRVYLVDQVAAWLKEHSST
ncbi:MAG: hypothetical protein PHD54_16045 [Desulfuromonadaceae bacterium]|nr:hypothetical protein [Desulfuromonadaceae bacterium]